VAWTQHDNYNAAVSDQRIAAANEASVVRYKGAHMKCLNRNVVVHAAEYRTEPEVVGRKVIFFFNKNNSAGNVPKGQEDLLARPYVLQDQSGGHTQDKLGFMFQEDTPPKNSKLTPAQIAARIEWLDADVTQLLTNPKTQSSRAMTGYPLMATSINTGQDYINCPIGADGQSTTADGQRAAYAIPGPAGHVESVLGAFGIPIAGTGK
jgi:hypothetical protein